MDIETSEQLVELARMGFYINSKDTASSPLKALAMASRSVKQPVYTAALRKYDFSEILPLAKSSNHFTALQNAFSEHMDEMIDLMPRKTEGKLLQIALISRKMKMAKEILFF